MAFSKGVVVLIIIVAVFLVLDGILIAGIVNASSNLNMCKKNQNPNCPNIMCNGDPTTHQAPSSGTPAADGTSSAMCWPYAFREIKDTNSNIVSYECNYPFTGRQPLIES